MGRGRPEQGLVDWSYASEKPGIRAYLAICGPNIATAIGYRAYKWGYMSTEPILKGHLSRLSWGYVLVAPRWGLEST